MSEGESVHHAMAAALSRLPCKCGRAPIGEQPDTYVAWGEVLCVPAARASNRVTRRVHLMQVDIYSKEPYDKLLAATLTALKEGGFAVSSYGPEGYEADTRYRHMPITCRWYDKEEM